LVLFLLLLVLLVLFLLVLFLLVPFLFLWDFLLFPPFGVVGGDDDGDIGGEIILLI
jgi:hypothetical protein